MSTVTLEDLLLLLASSNLRTRFPLSELAQKFTADAATLWQSGEIDRDEVILIAEHNRPDLISQIHKRAFVFHTSFVSKFLTENAPRWFILDTKAAATAPWDNDDLRVYTLNSYQNITCILFEGRTFRKTIVFLYYFSIGSIPSNEIMSKFTRIGGALIDTFWEEYRVLAEDRRKMGHEIGRFLNACNKAMAVVERTPKLRSAKRQKLFLDFRESLAAARTASENETFIEGVLARRQQTEPIALLKRVTDVTRSVNSRIDAFSNAINIPAYIYVVMNLSDFDLVVSNLVENAEKYSLSRAYVIRADYKAAGIRVRFSNPSEKLEPAMLEKVWRYKQRGTNSALQPGSGIGLTVTKDICNAYKIGHEIFQVLRDGRTWTHVELSFPPEMCRRGD